MARQMKDSGIEWIGEIPANWETIRFKYLHDGMNTGEAIDKENWTADDNDRVFYTAGLVPIHTNYSAFPDWKFTTADDLLLARNGTPYVYYPQVGACYTDHIIRAMMKRSSNKRFIQYCLQQSIASVVVETVSIPTWSASLWNEQVITWPSGDEQHRIAAFLDRKCAEIDAVIERTKTTIEEYKKLKQAVITEAVTKGVRGSRPMKDSGIEWIGEIPEGWEVCCLKRFCTFKTGSTPSTANDEWFDGDIDWYTPGDFNDDYILKESKRTLSQHAVDDGVATMIPADTVLIVGIGATAGKIGITTHEASCNQQITALIALEIISRYLMYWMIANTTFLRETALFTTLPILNNETIGEYLFIRPDSKMEQQEIASYLDEKCAAIDTLIAKKTALLTELETYKKSIIYEYVTGKKEVN